MKTNLIAAGIFIAVTNIIHHASAQTWTPTSAPMLPWTTIAASADGSRLVAAAGDILVNGLSTEDIRFPIYTSTDSGLTWTQTSAPSNYWSSITSSADGTKLAATALNREGFADLRPPQAHGLIYLSLDSGTNWTQTPAPDVGWTSIASSADGSTLVAATSYYLYYNQGQIYTSTNFGATWQQSSAPNNAWTSVASSTDGTKLVAVARYSVDYLGYVVSDGLIYTSTNSGVNWVPTSAPTNDWNAVASSANGMKLVSTVWAGGIYVSSDSGVTWFQSSAPNSLWISVASSADGNKLLAAANADDNLNPGQIYTSTNLELAWTRSSAPSNYWNTVICSADGGKLFAAAWYGTIYISQSTPTPLLSIDASRGNVGISWLVPSTSFTLQQNWNLNTTNWTDVPITPMLTLTNLNYKVSLSPTNGQCFYRLKQQ